MLAPTDQITKVLLGAADYIEQNGWCQGTAKIGDAVCAAWALTITAEGNSISEEAGRRLLRFVGPGSLNVPAWNDSVGRTKDGIVEALRSAAFAPATV